MQSISFKIEHIRGTVLEYLCYKFQGKHEECYEDAVQQAFTELYSRKLTLTFEHEKQIEAWIRVASYRNVLKLLSHMKRLLSLDAISADGIIDSGIEALEQEDLIIWFASQLPKKKAEVIKLYCDGHTTNDIADILDEKPDTIKHRFASAQKTLRILWEIDIKKK